MEHRWWATYNIIWGKSHGCPDVLCIIDEITARWIVRLQDQQDQWSDLRMGEHCSFGGARSSFKKG